MWKTLALVADEEVRVTEESVRSSNAALNKAAVELQDKIKVGGRGVSASRRTGMSILYSGLTL